MSAALTVSHSLRTIPAVARTIASLPMSLAYTDGPGELAAISGDPGWSVRLTAALAAGARGAIVLEPAPEEPPTVDIPVVLQRTFVSSPGLSAFAEAVGRLHPSALLEVRTVSRAEEPADVVLMRGLGLVRTGLGGSARDVQIVAANSGHLAARAVAHDGRPVMLTHRITVGRECDATLRAFDTTSRVDAAIPSEHTARPVRVTRVDADGASEAPTRFESGTRASWRRLIAAASGGQPLADLTEFHDDRIQAARAHASV